MKIKIFSHTMEADSGITHEQADLLESSKLIDAADTVYMLLHFDEDKFSWLKERWQHRKNVVYLTYDETYKDWYEFTTCKFLEENCHNDDEEFYALYIHHKGSYNRSHGNNKWRWYMQYWNIECWRDCVAKLDEGYDMCGAGFHDDPINPFYAGNFYWARSSQIKKRKRLIVPPTDTQFGVDHHVRFDAELWNGNGNPKWFDLHPGGHHRWYSSPESYRKND